METLEHVKNELVPFLFRAYLPQQAVVFVSILVDVAANVQNRERKELLLHQGHHHQDSSNSPIAIAKRVHRLKLVMCNGTLLWYTVSHIGLVEDLLQ